VWNAHLFGNAGKDDLRERIYVQTDKQLYLAGELIRMKLLTTDTEQIPLVFSKVAYAELVDQSVSQIQIKVELTNGAGEGQMQIPSDFPTGYYRLIAYTQFMRNEGPEVFFEKNIVVVNTYQSGYQPQEDRHSALDAESPYQEIAGDPETSSGRNDDNRGTVSLQPDKTIYTTRDRGALVLSGLPDNIHTLSVSVAGKEWMPVAESDVSLFRQNQTKKPAGVTGAFLPEYEGHIVTGKIVNNETEKLDNENGETEYQKLKDEMADAISNNDVRKMIEIGKKLEEFDEVNDEAENDIYNTTFLVPALAFPGDGIRFFPGQKTETGDVLFFTSGISGMKEIATVVYAADSRYRIDIQQPFVSRFAPEPMPSLHIDSAYYGQLLERSVALQVLHYFSDDDPSDRNVPEPHFKMKPSISYPLDEYTRFTTMREVFTEFIAGARFRRTDGKWRINTLVKRGNELNYGTMPLVLLDGVPISDHDIIFNYDPLTVEIINLYYGPCNIGGYQFDGIVELITYRGLHQDVNPDRSTQIISYNAPQPYDRFDTPDYSDGKNRQSRMPDSRHTLLWNPDVRTNGKTSIRLPFDTSDLTGEFQATVEGITEDGKFIFTTSFFKVER
jgi:hypothetical protein